MDDFRRCKGVLAFRGPNSIPNMIHFAEKLGREDMLGDVYYEAMLRGHKVWNSRRLDLNDHQVRTLGVGTVRCAEAGETLLRQYRSRHCSFVHDCANLTVEVLLNADGEVEETLKCAYSVFGRFGTLAVEEWERENIPWFDLLGRMRAVVVMSPPTPYWKRSGGEDHANCHRKILPGLKLALENERAHIWRRFRQEEEADDLESPEPEL